MNDALIGQIQAFTLNARAALEREADEQLQGVYGWLPDGTFADARRYPAVAHLDEARETRSRLERFAEDERTTGFHEKAARRKLMREAAFTWLNRIVAFRLMEERRLIKQTIVRLDKSNGFIFWLTEDSNKDSYALHQQGGLPLNAMGEGPIDVAYRRFLLYQCSELAREVSVLFDPHALASRLCPRPPVLKQLLADMNAEPLVEAWKPGNEETIGWVYQAFNAEELQASFASAREQGKKFEPEDIPAVTQLFTIRWVVRFLIENTLGRLWLEMHPDSRLVENLAYLVPAEKPEARPVRLARDITFLDPCCGSMHFGLLAFDLLTEMYREELEKVGQPGWPDKASVETSDEIAATIVAHNIHGIDLDVRAVQLSALTLLLRARTLNPKCIFTDQNLACANIEKITGGSLEQFIKQAHFEHPIYERILHSLAARLKDSDNLGSLLRLEKDLQCLTAEERQKAIKEARPQLSLPKWFPERFDSAEALEQFFEQLSKQVMQQLDEFVRAARTHGHDATHFVSETAKGLRFLRLIQYRYDVVATNPPYLSSRKMNQRLAILMNEEFPEAKSDLYAAFIVRCQELLKDEGLMGMLTMHSFMFISSYEGLRDKLRRLVAIETLAHFGGGLFSVGNPGTLQTAAYVLRREPNEHQREEQVAVYFRLVKEPDADSKRRAFEAALAALRSGQAHPQVYRYIQKDFDVIPKAPWVYWISKRIQEIFLNLAKLKDFATPASGQNTGDNFRFIRYWWEVGIERINRNAKDDAQARQSGKKWFPYMKGGPFKRWYGNQYWCLNWHEDGRELKEFCVIRNKGRHWSRYLQNLEYNFQAGITYSFLTSSSFSARVSPGGFLFDYAGCSVFGGDLALVLALLNSSFGSYCLRLINPTVNFQPGDLCRLPYPKNTNGRIAELVDKAVDVSKLDSCHSEMTYDFIKPWSGPDDFSHQSAKLAGIEDEVDRAVSDLYMLKEEELAAIHRELSSQPLAIEDGEKETTEQEEGSTDVTNQSWAQSWISYAFGIVLSRFEIGVPGGLGQGDFAATVVASVNKLVALDGIVVTELGNERDCAPRVWETLVHVLGEEGGKKIVRTACGVGNPDEQLRAWLEKQFWRYHFQLYRKCPVYWPLQSPKKKFTVWVFHERFTKNTLFDIRQHIVEPRVRLLQREIADKRREAESNRGAAKVLDKLRDFEDDLREFSKRLKAVADRGYTPHIDDGVLLNAAPLHSLLPSWPDTKKAWEEIEGGEYDWAQQAMEYWPDRVKDKCKTNKSFALAHGLA